MPTFDLVEVQDFVAGLDARMSRGEDGEGTEHVSFDDALRHHADLCREFYDMVRRWGREVFAGRVAFDPEVERAWLTEGWQLHHRARELRDRGQSVGDSGSQPGGREALQGALGDLHRLLSKWVTPKLSVGPSARLGFGANPPEADEIRRRIASLPPLPADWEPDDPEQRERFRRPRTP